MVSQLNLYGDPGKIRTSDTQFRKLLLYPPELRGHGKIFLKKPQCLEHRTHGMFGLAIKLCGLTDQSIHLEVGNSGYKLAIPTG